ncbi:YjgB family protein [Terribacillus sp. 179-K 1B1 HS]|uniref:YjgB family protein n=1 Tax=Terribacillus sp. 179-K 1B1 HS TaxID=3142388 RepID=UPI00399F2C31
MIRRNPARKAAISVACAGAVLGAGSFVNTGAVSVNAEAGEAIHSSETNEAALETLQTIYTQAYEGSSVGLAGNFTIGESTRTDVVDRLGKPFLSDTFDTYHAEMGNPGFSFAYSEDGILSEIRYLGTNVERQTNLGSITPAILEEELGKADAITSISQTDQHKYLYETGDFELEFIVNDETLQVDHVNLVPNS